MDVLSHESSWYRRLTLSIGLLMILLMLIGPVAAWGQQPQPDTSSQPGQTIEGSNGEPGAAPGPGAKLEDVNWGDLPWGFLGITAIFGAIGGVVYELIALQGNIEWPHPSRKDEQPSGGYDHATLPHLFDLGILARILIGATAAIVVFWVLPPVGGVHLIAIALVAGSTGIAVFRSVQDRLLAQLNAAKTEAMWQGLKKVHDQAAELEGEAAAEDIKIQGVSASGKAAVQAKAANLRGQIEALLEIGGR